MRGTTHLITGLTAGMALSSALGASPAEVTWPALLVGTLAPDIDEENSLIARPGTLCRRFLPRFVADVADIVGVACATVIRTLFGHRGLLHGLLVPAVLFVAAWSLALTPLAWFAVGYAVHLLGDMLTVAGIPLFAPFSSRKSTVGFFRTGSGIELVIALLCALYISHWGYQRLPQSVRNQLPVFRVTTPQRQIAAD